MLLWYLTCRINKRCPDRFYSYVGFGIWLIPRVEGYDPWGFPDFETVAGT